MTYAFLVALLVAGLVGSVLVLVLRWRHPSTPGWRPALVFVFVMLLAASWAGGAWLAPAGPVLLGRAVLPMLLVGVFAALVLAAASAPPARQVRPRHEGQQARAATAFGLFFWLLTVGLVVAIVLSYGS